MQSRKKSRTSYRSGLHLQPMRTGYPGRWVVRLIPNFYLLLPLQYIGFVGPSYLWCFTSLTLMLFSGRWRCFLRHRDHQSHERERAQESRGGLYLRIFIFDWKPHYNGFKSSNNWVQYSKSSHLSRRKWTRPLVFTRIMVKMSGSAGNHEIVPKGLPPTIRWPLGSCNIYVHMTFMIILWQSRSRSSAFRTLLKNFEYKFPSYF